MIYEVRVDQTKYQEACYSFYNIEAETSYDAEREARQKFSDDFGFKFQDTKAFTLNKQYHDNF